MTKKNTTRATGDDGDDESKEDASDDSTDGSLDEEEEGYPYWSKRFIVREARVAK